MKGIVAISMPNDIYIAASQRAQSLPTGTTQCRPALYIRHRTATRRMCLAGLLTTLLLRAVPAQGDAAPIVQMESGHQNKLIALLRKRGVRGGLRADVSAILGLYNRGDNMLVSQMRVKTDEAILTFARIVMRQRELYCWAIQPNVRDLTTYFFLTNGSFNLVARGVELKDDKAAALPAERTKGLFGEIMKAWISILDES